MIENILDILFNIFIYPIEYLMMSIIDIMFAMTSNYGLSIILLSIIINLIILPLYYLAEKLKNDNQKILDKLQPQIDTIKRNHTKQELHFYLQALYNANYYHPINNIKASLGLLLQIPFFIAAFHFIGNYEVFNQVSFGIISDLGKSDELLFGLNILPFVMTIISLLSVYLYSKDMNKSEKYQLLGMAFIFLVFLYFESSALLLYWSMNSLFSFIRSFIENKFNLDNFKSKAISLLTIPYYKIKENKELNFIVKDVYIQALILFFGTIFIYKAIPMAASDTGMYLAHYPLVVLSLIGIFLACVVIFYFIYLFLPKKLRYVVTILAVFGALSGVFYSFIYPFEVEILDTIRIPKFIIYEDKILKLFKLALLALVFLFIALFLNKIKSTILIIIVFSNIFLITQTITVGLNPMSTKNTKKNNINLSEEEVKRLYSFSKDSNVIVILFDGFQGNLLYDILDKHPTLKQDLEGFTYYPNTISYSNGTYISIGPMLGGDKHKLQNRIYPSPNSPFVKSALIHDISYLDNMQIAKKYNHSYSIYYYGFLSSCNIFNKYENSFCSNKAFFNQKEATKQKMMVNTSNIYSDIIIHLSQMSFILSVPHEFKARINFTLNDGLMAYHGHLTQYQQLKNMSYFANTNSSKKTFKFIHNLITHGPYLIDNDCNIGHIPVRGYNGAFNSGYCSLKRIVTFVKTLKRLKVYNKTKIIIASDHGASLTTKNRSMHKGRASALMLVKDFNASGNLTISNILLSNADTYSISLSGISQNKETKLDPIKNIDTNRSVLYVIPNGRTLVIKKIFEVKKSIYNKDNWEELSNKKMKELIKY